VPEETEWQNRVRPVPPPSFQALPYGPEPEELPAGSLRGQPDEDFWQNPVAAVPACPPRASGGWPPALYGQLPYLPDPTEDPAGSPHGLPEEAEWQNWVAPLSASFCQQFPYASAETAEVLPQAVSPPEEDFWQNPVPYGTGQNPVPGLIPNVAACRGTALPLPYLPDGEEIPAGSLYGVPEEFYWQNPVPPVPAAMWQPMPYLGICGFDDFSCFWWTSRWAVRTHSAARERLSHSAVRERASPSAARGRGSHSAARERISRSTARPRTSAGTSRQSSFISG
jgi:hypothetical protein